MRPRYIYETNEYWFNGRYYEADDPEQMEYLADEIERHNEIEEENDAWERGEY